MQNYHDLLALLLSDEANTREDRTDTGTRSIFGHQLRFDLSKGYPLLTTKRLHFKSIIHELLWFISGSTNVKYLQENGVSIWNEWADEQGELGPVYGKQWRNFAGIDQFKDVIDGIKTHPNSRRLVVSAWNPSDLPSMALPPCHVLFQFYVHDGTLSLSMYQRSADAFLGLPFNIASYAAMLIAIANECKLKPKDLVISLGDAHLYKNHIEQAKELLTRRHKALPYLTLPKGKSVFDLVYEDFSLSGYNPHPAIKAPIAI